MVGTAVVNIVSGLDEEDEQSTDNINIIANVYDDITDLVETGNITVTENVRIPIRCGSIGLDCNDFLINFTYCL